MDKDTLNLLGALQSMGGQNQQAQGQGNPALAAQALQNLQGLGGLQQRENPSDIEEDPENPGFTKKGRPIGKDPITGGSWLDSIMRKIRNGGRPDAPIAAPVPTPTPEP